MFVRELYERSEAATWAEFATRAGVNPVQLSRWQSGASVPDGYNLVRLIKAVGETGYTVRVREEQLKTLQDLLVELGDGIEDLAMSVAGLPQDIVARLEPQPKLEEPHTEQSPAELK